ncbi:metallopeptidase family protein [Chloroflexus sp.]|uniref:metallopeptidase family protein n=1 Tax=Chloroflexus sp. TaxID=1904827 RepID=UPI002606AD67|nr:metallopeptidase family protein [uncultured Chloroflexus sp.]
MKKPEFADLVAEVLESLPPAFARYLETVEVLIAPRPSREQRRALGLRPWQTIYGLYEGIPITEQHSGDIVSPATITIFQEPLERDFRTTTALREQVRRTVLHEIAHHFGISDERLRDLNAY